MPYIFVIDKEINIAEECQIANRKDGAQENSLTCNLSLDVQTAVINLFDCNWYRNRSTMMRNFSYHRVPYFEIE